jgi:hypothetical protein
MTNSKVKVTLQLAVYRQSVRLGVKPLETHDQTFFQLNSCGNSPYVTSSPREDGFVSYEYAWPFVKCTFHTYSMLLMALLYSLGMNHTENITSNSSSIVVCISIAMDTCLI